ncbi:MAG: O-antigen ligase family protein [Clostridia bacterium]|nr:O-antigen ligase family protein [Clostridia bacterium]
MKNASNKSIPKRIFGRFAEAVKNSRIVSALDRLCLKVYDLLCNGMFARLICGSEDSADDGSAVTPKKDGFISRLTGRISRGIESSGIVSFVNRTANAVFGLRLRVVGTFLMTFAVMCILSGAVRYVFLDTTAALFDALGNGATALTVALLSVPMLVSKGTLSEVLRKSALCTGIVRILGFSEDKLWSDEIRGKHWTAFLLGCLVGISSVFVDPLLIFAAIAGVILMYLVLSFPEFGVMGLALLMPFVPTMVLAGLTIFVDIAFFIKLIRGKRVLNFRKIDFIVLIFAFLVFCAGFVSHSTGSIAPALLFLCLLSIYFVVSCCIRSEKWIGKIVASLMLSAAVVALYGIVQYAFGTFGVNAWLDSDLFEGIAGRAASTLENPNMLGEYLILIIPIAFAAFLNGSRNAAITSRKLSFLCFASMAMCLVLTWSRGAWLGFMFSAVIFLLIWSKRSMWLFALGIISLPVLPFVLPDSIINRFASIGNMADSSTSYRVSIWRAATHMIEDNFFSGIGIGEAAWFELYPDYALAGIEAAPHSHNLFFQIALEQGIFGLVVFFIILFLLLRISFRLFKRLGNSASTVPLKDSAAMRLTVAAPICGLAAVLLQGLTDYSWYNYRVYFIFWLVLALIPAYVKHYNKKLDSHGSCFDKDCMPDEASVDIALTDKTQNSVK